MGEPTHAHAGEGAGHAVQARRFIEEGHLLRLVVTFKGGRELALGREMVAFLLEQLEGEPGAPTWIVVINNQMISSVCSFIPPCYATLYHIWGVSTGGVLRADWFS